MLVKSALALGLLGLAACDGTVDEGALLDPASCQSCHPDHFREWSGSMHAHASDDPVFRALQALGQRETGGALGTLCIGCHAPMAVPVMTGAEALELEEVPRHLQGVTCYACHRAVEIQALHNGAIVRVADGVERGGIADPVATPAHGSVGSRLLDGAEVESSQLCGACHDVTLPGGVEIERTYAEWSETIFAGEAALSCAACHLPGRDGVAAVVPGTVMPPRRVHDHAMPGIDVALVDWPERDVQRAAVERDLAGAVRTTLCVVPGAAADIQVTLDNLLVGHAFPSGVTHSRRVWVEVVAWAGEEIVYQTGVVEPGEAVGFGDDPDLWLLRSRFYDAAGDETDLVWEAASVEADLLLPTVTLDTTDPRYYHAIDRTFTVAALPDRVTLAVHVQPIGLDILDALIATGDLAPAVRDAMPTFTIAGATHEWRQARDGWGCAP